MSWIHDMLDIPEDMIDQFETYCQIEAAIERGNEDEDEDEDEDIRAIEAGAEDTLVPDHIDGLNGEESVLAIEQMLHKVYYGEGGAEII